MFCVCLIYLQPNLQTGLFNYKLHMIITCKRDAEYHNCAVHYTAYTYQRIVKEILNITIVLCITPLSLTNVFLHHDAAPLQLTILATNCYGNAGQEKAIVDSSIEHSMTIRYTIIIYAKKDLVEQKIA